MKTPLTQTELMQNIDVSVAILEVLQTMLENTEGIRDFYFLSTLAREGKQKLMAVIEDIADREM